MYKPQSSLRETCLKMRCRKKILLKKGLYFSNLRRDRELTAYFGSS